MDLPLCGKYNVLSSPHSLQFCFLVYKQFSLPTASHYLAIPLDVFLFCTFKEMSQSAFRLSFVPLFCLLFLGHFVCSQLDYKFYDSTCPNLTKIVRFSVWSAIANDTRMAASLLRLHSHDCIVDVITIVFHVISVFLSNPTLRINPL